MIGQGESNAIYHGLGKSTVKRVQRYNIDFLLKDDYYESESESNYEKIQFD